MLLRVGSIEIDERGVARPSAALRGGVGVRPSRAALLDAHDGAGHAPGTSSRRWRSSSAWAWPRLTGRVFVSVSRATSPIVSAERPVVRTMTANRP